MADKDHLTPYEDGKRWAERLRRIAGGDPSAFGELYRRFAPTVYHIALNILQDAAEAEDVCHDVFLELMQHPDRFDPDRGTLQAWLAVKAKSRAIDRLRRQQRQSAAAPWREPSPHRDPTGEAVVGRLEREQLHEALNRLPAGQRDAITATYLNAMTHQEWARVSGHPLGTVKSRIRYGLKNIRKNLVQLGWLEPAEGGRAHGANPMERAKHM